MRFLHLFCAACLWLATAAFAQNPHAPQPLPGSLAKLAGAERTVLTVQGPKGTQTWTLQQLEALGLHRVSTDTFWPDDNGTYEGVLLVDVLRKAGLEHAPFVRVAALDGFSQKIPRADWDKWPVMLATRKAGAAITTRNKGPLRIIYPRNMAEELSNGIYRLRWVWLVTRIDTQGQ